MRHSSLVCLGGFMPPAIQIFGVLGKIGRRCLSGGWLVLWNCSGGVRSLSEIWGFREDWKTMPIWGLVGIMELFWWGEVSLRVIFPLPSCHWLGAVEESEGLA